MLCQEIFLNTRNDYTLANPSTSLPSGLSLRIEDRTRASSCNVKCVLFVQQFFDCCIGRELFCKKCDVITLVSDNLSHLLVNIEFQLPNTA